MCVCERERERRLYVYVREKEREREREREKERERGGSEPRKSIGDELCPLSIRVFVDKREVQH